MAKEIKNENAEAVAEAVSKTELFFTENKKILLTVLAVILVAGAAFFCWHKFINQPKVEEAQAQMALAEANFRNAADSTGYALALRGDGNVLGFELIIDEYGSKAGTSVYFYAGICEYNLKNYSQAISYLKSYKGQEDILAARALACIGDCQVDLGDLKGAISSFEKAASKADNMFAADYLLKAGIAAEAAGDKAKALSFYKKVKEQYPMSELPSAREIDKYISRIEAE